MAKLPLTVTLGAFEPASSYLSRLAARNGISPQEFCSDFALGIDDLLAGKSEPIAALAAVGGVDPGALAAWTPVHVDARRTRFRALVLTRSTMSSDDIRGCPHCLAHDAAASARRPVQAMYLRAFWRHEFSFVCLEHGQWLSPLWRDKDARTRLDSAGHFERRDKNGLAPLSDQPVTPTAFDLWLAARFVGQSGKSWLDQFDFQASLDFCDLLGRSLVRAQFPQLADMTRQDRWRAVSAAFEIATQGETAIQAIFMQMQNQGSAPQDGPQRRFGVLYGNLNRYHTGPEYEPFRRLLRAHIFETWPIDPGTEILGARLKKRRKHSILTAARETGYSRDRVRAILASHGHVPPSGQGDMAAWEVFDAEPAQDLIMRIARGGTIKQIQAALNITPSQVTTLRQSGFLWPSVDGKGHRPLWDLAEAKAFLDQLSLGAVPVSEAAPEWEEIGKAALRLRIPPGDIIRMRLSGQLASLGQRSGKPGYQGLLVKPAEVKAKMAVLADDVLNIEDFAKKVGLRWPAARRLITMGLIPSTLRRNPASGLMQPYLSPADLTAFKTRYVTLITLGEELGMPWQKVVGWFRKADIPKVTAEGQDFGQLYERRLIPPDWFQRRP